MNRLALALAAALLPLPAHAAPDDDAVAAVIREEGQRAQTAFVEKDYAAAALLYERIEPLLATLPERDKELAIVRFNLGRCYDELGRPIDAIGAYRKSVQGPLEPALTDPIRERITTLEARALGSLTVNCAAPDARVELVGHPGAVGRCGHRFDRLAPGPYVIAVTTGDRRTTHPAEVTAGAAARLEPFAPVDAARADDHTFAWILTGTAAAALAGGVVFNVLARADRQDGDDAFAAWQADMTPQNQQRALDADDAAQTKATVSYTLFGVGAALGLAAAWVWLDDDDPAPVTPLVAPGAVGLIGRF